MAIKTVILDLGRVIVPFEFDRAYRQMEAMTGLAPEQIRARIGTTDLVPSFERGEVEPAEFVRRLGGQMGFDLAYERFCEIWSSIFLPEALIPAAFLQELRRNYRMLLLSNTNAIHFGMIRETYPQLEHFDRYVLSFEVGALKPSPRIYEEALRHAGCEPGECFFTDDIPEYVEGARRAGIDAEQFLGFEKLRSDLRARGVEA